MQKLEFKQEEIKIPSRLNVLILFISIVVAFASQYFASNAASIWGKISAIVVFSYVANTFFSLLHEAVHGVLHADRKINNLMGCVSAAFFPTGFHFQKICHIGHHLRNRTDAEMFEAYNEKDNKFIKTILLYYILTGVYWITAPVGSLWYLFDPKGVLTGFFRARGNYNVKRLGAEDMLAPFESLLPWQVKRIRLEILFTVVLQVAMFLILDLNWTGYLACYFLFAFKWSALQYADHAYSERNVRNGAWNLKVNPIDRVLFLNYHYHLVHHRYPQIPWIHLGKFVDKKNDLQSFWKIYLRMWKGLVKYEATDATGLDQDLQKILKAQSIVN